jgi:hypothetical protein
LYYYPEGAGWVSGFPRSKFGSTAEGGIFCSNPATVDNSID